ncbi:Protein MOTHER of FT and TF 1 [Platanthera guangdongensis]|uniref:Protein MOTHER of FT and TF 1 n=1 Tax=Platanthera guangdongensis TaxID=2320717 RepID=A0ABR2LFN1_9ASPA
MTTCVDPLVVGGVIGDVIDLFVPMVTMSVHFGSKHINNGCEITPSLAANLPTVNISGRRFDRFTLVMTDPDAPSPSEPTLRELVHWVVVNIPGSTDASHGQELVPYMGPKPPLGIHRYVLVLFHQQSEFRAVAPPTTRANFSTRDFAVQCELGLPVAVAYFNSQKQPAARRR